MKSESGMTTQSWNDKTWTSFVGQ